MLGLAANVSYSRVRLWPW